MLAILQKFDNETLYNREKSSKHIISPGYNIEKR